MARVCQNCGKGYNIATRRVKLRGKYNPTTKYRQYPNLQPIRIGGKKLIVCSDCRRKLLKSATK